MMVPVHIITTTKSHTAAATITTIHQLIQISTVVPAQTYKYKKKRYSFKTCLSLLPPKIYKSISAQSVLLKWTKRLVCQKFGFIKINLVVKVKAKQQWHMTMKQLPLLLLIGSMVRIILQNYFFLFILYKYSHNTHKIILK